MRNIVRGRTQGEPLRGRGRLLSVLSFTQDYVETIMTIGERDAERQAERLTGLLEPGQPPRATPAPAPLPAGPGVPGDVVAREAEC